MACALKSVPEISETKTPNNLVSEIQASVL